MTTDGATFVEETEALPEAPPPKVYPTKLDRIDQLEVENLFLKVQNMAAQEMKLHEDLMKANQLRQEYQKKMIEVSARLSEKYGVNISANTTKILEDGTIIDMLKGPQLASVPTAPQKAG